MRIVIQGAELTALLSTRHRTVHGVGQRPLHGDHVLHHACRFRGHMMGGEKGGNEGIKLKG